MEETWTMVFHWLKRNQEWDIEVPSFLTANELVYALNEGFGLGIDTTDIDQCYLKTTNPVALLKGKRPLAEYGLRHGTDLWFER